MCGIAHSGKQLLILRCFTNSIVFFKFTDSRSVRIQQPSFWNMVQNYAKKGAWDAFRGLGTRAVKRSLGCRDLWGLTPWNHQCYLPLASLIQYAPAFEKRLLEWCCNDLHITSQACAWASLASGPHTFQTLVLETFSLPSVLHRG